MKSFAHVFYLSYAFLRVSTRFYLPASLMPVYLHCQNLPLVRVIVINSGQMNASYSAIYT
jgi:hypothetical protein